MCTRTLLKSEVQATEYIPKELLPLLNENNLKLLDEYIYNNDL